MNDTAGEQTRDAQQKGETLEVICAFCRGTGKHPRFGGTCTTCGGAGTVPIPADDVVPCPCCGGSGVASPQHRRRRSGARVGSIRIPSRVLGADAPPSGFKTSRG